MKQPLPEEALPRAIWTAINDNPMEPNISTIGAREVVDAIKPWLERDEFHTMDELYEYRMLYNALAFNQMALTTRDPALICKSWRHSDGELCFGGGWFIVVAELPTGQISNHYKAEHWNLFNIPIAWTPPEYDGHTPAEAASRMRRYLRDAVGGDS